MDIKIKTTKLGTLYATVVEEGDDPVYEIQGVRAPDGTPVRVRQSEIDSMRAKADEYRERTRYPAAPAADQPDD